MQMIAYRMYQSRVQRIWLIRIVIIDSARCGGGGGRRGMMEKKKKKNVSRRHFHTYLHTCSFVEYRETLH